MKARLDSIPARIGLAAVHLHQAAEKNTPAAVKDEIDSLRDLYSRRTSSFSADDKEDFIVNLIVFLCLQHEYAAAEQLIQVCVADGRLPAKTADEIRAEMKK